MEACRTRSCRYIPYEHTPPLAGLSLNGGVLFQFCRMENVAGTSPGLIEQQSPRAMVNMAQAHEIIEDMLRDAFTQMMTIVDEEDAVLLYRCTRIAESSR